MKESRLRMVWPVLLVIILSLANRVMAEDEPTVSILRENFILPPAYAAPGVWWHWMSGEVTKEGISKDLEAMKQVGIGEATIFDIGDGRNDGDGGGHIFDNGKNKLFSEDWNALISHAMSEAKRLGIQLSAHNSPGWSGSGGPWVSAEDSMKTLTWRTVKISGGKPTEVTVEKPERQFGFYKDTGFYRDIAVFAIKGIEAEDIIDLSGKLKNDTLVWDAPSGDWTIVRMGYASSGNRNRVARPGGEGMEVDKMDAAAVQREFYNGMTGKLLELEKTQNSCLSSFTIDSWEVGYQTWTESFPGEFEKRRGYSIDKYLPVLAGFTVGSEEISRRFLWDYNLTLGELIHDNYAATMHKLSNKHGKKLVIEPYSSGNFHTFDYGNQADYVMSEFWQGELDSANIQAVASIAHATGKKEHRAESFTTCYYNSGWRSHPWQLKTFGDQAFCLGINAMVFHTFAQSSLADDVVPGMSMGRWGMMLGRHQTWWPMAKEYITYLSRCQYLLRQGNFAADLLYVTDEHLPKPAIDIVRESGQACPEGYRYDVISPDFFVRHAAVKNKQVCFPAGASYPVVVLPKTQQVTVAFIRKIEELARGGVIMVASDYTAAPGLQGYRQSDAVVKGINNKLKEASRSGNLPNYYPQAALSDVLAVCGIGQDLAYQNLPADVKLNFIHQRLQNADVYFIANQAPKRVRSLCSFKVTEGAPMAWDPVTGQISTINVYDRKDGRTDIVFHLDKWQSMFVIFGRSEKNQRLHFTALRSEHQSQDTVKPKLEILKAVTGCIYKPTPDANTDITEQLRGMVKDDRLYFKSDSRMAIHYKLNDEWSCSMQQTIDVQAGAPAAGPMDATIEDGPDGLVLKTDEPGNYFVKQTDGKEQKIEVLPYDNRLSVTSPWKVSFQENRGVDKEFIVLDKLVNLSEHEDFNIRHFSGLITYETTIDVPREFVDKNAGLTLEFERISNMAQVSVNDVDCGIVWSRPYTANVARALKPGSNKLTITVANSWSNRLIGDEYYPIEFRQNTEGAMTEPIGDWAYSGDLTQRPTKERIAFTTNRFYSKDDPLPPSGIDGEVVLKKWVTVKLK